MLLLAWGVPAQAQELRIEATSAQRCLMPATADRGLPDYRRPDVVLLERGDGPAAPEFVAAVKEHVRTWRLPCLEVRETASRLRLDFVF